MAIRFLELYEENKESFQLKLVAGKAGMDTVVSWVHMLEDETIVSRFNGEELAITTCMKIGVRPEWLLDLVKQMHRMDCAGIIVNTGMYINKIPDVVISWCEEHNFPVLTMPWDKSITDLIQRFCMRIMDQKQYEKRIGSVLLKAMNGIGTKQEYEQFLEEEYDIHGEFQAICIHVKRFHEDENIYTQAIRKLENVFGIGRDHKKIAISYSLLSVQNHLALILNHQSEKIPKELPEMIRQSFSYFTERDCLHIGIGPKMLDIENLSITYKRSLIAMKMAIDSRCWCVSFDEMGIYKILYSVEDTELLQNYAYQVLEPLLEYDEKHKADYLDTLRSYIENDRSLIKVSEKTFTHRNTVNYRIQNMKQLLNNDLKTVTDLLPYEIALMILDMIHGNVKNRD